MTQQGLDHTALSTARQIVAAQLQRVPPGAPAAHLRRALDELDAINEPHQGIGIPAETLIEMLTEGADTWISLETGLPRTSIRAYRALYGIPARSRGGNSTTRKSEQAAFQHKWRAKFREQGLLKDVS